jgi:hypothetical protein
MKTYVLNVWSVIDVFYYACSRLKYIEKNGSDRNVFRVRLTRYKGRPVVLSDGTRIGKNDILMKIHLHNVYLCKQMGELTNDVQKGKFIYRSVEKSLPGLADYVRNHPREAEIKGIMGITFLAKGSSRLGFDTFPLVRGLYKLYKWTTLFPIYFISVSRVSKQTLRKQTPQYLFMSKERLLQQYGSQCH